MVPSYFVSSFVFSQLNKQLNNIICKLKCINIIFLLYTIFLTVIITQTFGKDQNKKKSFSL